MLSCQRRLASIVCPEIWMPAFAGMTNIRAYFALITLINSSPALAIDVAYVDKDLSQNPITAAAFTNAVEEKLALMAQPMAIPRPKETKTSELKVRAVHNGSWIAFQLNWLAKEKSEAGKLGTFSDAVAVQFPVLDNKAPPPIFMGVQGNPVHIYHWRAQYQKDRDQGMRSMKDIYPHMHVDNYPLEFSDKVQLNGLNDANREVFVTGLAAGNAQSFQKVKGFDEIIAEGFGSSSVIDNTEGLADGSWVNGEWSVVIARPLKRLKGSVLEAGASSFTAFAVWQGSEGEVGSRKSVTMNWVPIKLAALPSSKLEQN